MEEKQEEILEDKKVKSLTGLLSKIESFIIGLKSFTKDTQYSIKEKKNKEVYDVSVDDVQDAHSNIPKKIGMITVGIGLIIILIMTIFTVQEQVSEVDKKRLTVERNTTDEEGMDISISDQAWKHFQSKKIDLVSKNTKKVLQQTQEELKKQNEALQKNIQNDLNNTVATVKSYIGKLSTRIEMMENNISKKLEKQKKSINAKLKNNINYVKTMQNHNQQNRISGGYETLNDDSKLLPPPYSSFSSKVKNIFSGDDSNEKKDVNKTKRIVYIEPDEDGYDYSDVAIDDIDIEEFDVATNLYTDSNTSEVINNTFHIMKGLTNATLLTGVNAPTFGGSENKNPAPALFSIDGDAVISNNEDQVLEDCFVSGSATGNVNTSRADILLTEISCSGYNEDGERIKVEQPIKGWVIGEDGSFGLEGRLLDSSGKVITKMIALEILKSISSAIVLSAQPQNTAIGSGIGAGTVVPSYNQAAEGGFGTGVSKGLEHAFEHYDEILSGMYPTISVLAGKKISILLKGGEDMTPSVYDELDINSKFEVKR